MKIILTETQVKKLVDALSQQELTDTIKDPKDFILIKKKTNRNGYSTYRP
jgi:hypothetical protein